MKPMKVLESPDVANVTGSAVIKRDPSWLQLTMKPVYVCVAVTPRDTSAFMLEGVCLVNSARAGELWSDFLWKQ